MSIDEYQQILADLVFRKVISFREAQELLRRFVAGEFDTQDLPMPLAEATKQEDNNHEVLIILAALGLGIVRSKRQRIRERLRIAARESLRVNFEQMVIESLQAGDVRSWHEGMASMIRNYNVANWMAGNGQFDTPNLGQRVQRQLQFVYRFATERHATDALGRPYSAEYLANRGTQYRGSAYAAWFEGNESVSQGDGWVSEYRARDDNRTCSPCTVAQGFIIWDNKRYTYRQVRWTPKQCEQANITANRLGGDWDFDELANWDMSDLLSWGFEESDFPFDVKPLTEEGKDTEPEISRADELLAKWKVKPGDMFALGEHRLICGDCTDRAVVERVMGGDLPSLLVTSPPYGVGKDYEQGGVEEWLRTIQGCFTVAGNHVLLWFVNLGNKRTGGEGFETSNFSMMESEFLKLGFKMVSLRIWSKDPAWAGQNPYWLQTYKPVDDFEFLGTFAKSKPKHKKRLTDDEYKQWGWRGIWEFPSVHSNEIHSAMFPLELPTRAIKLYTDESSAIYEPFSGSGTTIIASQNLNRKCRAVEISPAYCAVAIERFHQHTGIEPVLLP